MKTTMNISIEDQVAQFNEQITNFVPPSMPSIDLVAPLIELRVKQLKEEVQETEDALNEKNLVKTVDGLIDLVYFAIGTLHIVGVHRDRLRDAFWAVHCKNMEKKPGINESRRIPGLPDHLHPTDAVKPEGWTSADKLLEVILNASDY